MILKTIFFKKNIIKLIYPFIASTVAILPGSISFSIFSIPLFKVKVEGIKAQFSYGNSLNSLEPIGEPQDYSILSDEVAQKFNGVFIGMYATSLGKESKQIAKFDWFLYDKI